MGGPPPKPSAIRDLEGDLGNRRRNKLEPLPPVVLRDPPPHFSKTQRAVWFAALAAAPPGMLRTTDWSVLAVWCVAADLHRKASEEVEKGGLTFKTESGYEGPSPWVSILNRQAEVMLRSASLLGFAPTTRTRVMGDGPVAPPPQPAEPAKVKRVAKRGHQNARGLWLAPSPSGGSSSH